MQHRSRDAEASEACPSVRSKARNIPERRHGAEIIRNPRNDGWQGTNERKNGKEAERQKTHLQNGPHLAGAAARGSPRARLSAFHHGTCGNERTPPLSSCDALAGAELGRNGRYPFPAAIRSSDLTQAGRECRPGVIAGAARERGDEPPPAGTAPAPPGRRHRPASCKGARLAASTLPGCRCQGKPNCDFDFSKPLARACFFSARRTKMTVADDAMPRRTAFTPE